MMSWFSVIRSRHLYFQEHCLYSISLNISYHFPFWYPCIYHCSKKNKKPDYSMLLNSVSVLKYNYIWNNIFAYRRSIFFKEFSFYCCLVKRGEGRKKESLASDFSFTADMGQVGINLTRKDKHFLYLVTFLQYLYMYTHIYIGRVQEMWTYLY